MTSVIYLWTNLEKCVPECCRRLLISEIQDLISVEDGVQTDKSNAIPAIW